MNENSDFSRWLDAARVYVQPRVLVVMLLGFSSGLPLALSGSTLLYWMRDRGVDLTTIGLFSLAGVPYTLKFIWAPLVDAARIPVLCKRFGQRRGWLLFTQLVLMACIFALGSLDPVKAPFFIALGAVLVATASATQDIVIDAFRIGSLDDSEQAAGVAVYVAAYRVAMLVSSGGVIGLVGWLEQHGTARDQIWFYGYSFAAAMVLVGIVAVLMAREPARIEVNAGKRPDVIETMRSAFAEFFTRPHALAILLFILLYKFCDSLAGVLTGPFVLDLGFEKTTYAGIVKGAGFLAVLAGGFAGGMLAKRLSLWTSLMFAGILQMASNLMFSWLSLMGTNVLALALAITVENLSGGIGTVIFVAYISHLCKNPLHTATQFALLTALASTGRTILSSSAGFIAEATGWFWFFAITALAALPGLALLVWLKAVGHFDDEDAGDLKKGGAP